MIKRLKVLHLRRAGKTVLLIMLWMQCAVAHHPNEASDPHAGSAVTSAAVTVSTPAAIGSLAPNFATGPDGTIVMSWLEPTADGYSLRYSSWADSGWSDPATVAQGDNWFVNWADFPSVVPITGKFWVAHWLVRRPAGGYAYDIAVSVSNDGGENWGKPLQLHRDNTDTEHGFVSIYPAEAGTAGLVWLDGRNTAVKNGGMTLRTATLGTDGALADEQEIDNLICDCCQTDAVALNENVVVAYRDRTRDEIRDIYVSRKVGSAWTDGIAVAADNWEIGGCPVNGPTLAARDNVTVVAWFTAANDKPRVRLGRSHDGGKTFASPIDVVDGHTLGRVGVAMMPDGSSIVSALTRNAEESVLLSLIPVATDGQRGASVAIADGVHPFSVPQLIVQGDSLLAAWTVRENGTTAIHSASIALPMSNAEGVESVSSN